MKRSFPELRSAFRFRPGIGCDFLRKSLKLSADSMMMKRLQKIRMVRMNPVRNLPVVMNMMMQKIFLNRK